MILNVYVWKTWSYNLDKNGSNSKSQYNFEEETEININYKVILTDNIMIHGKMSVFFTEKNQNYLFWPVVTCNSQIIY